MAQATAKQINFINGLVRERTVNDDAKRRIATLITDGMDVGKAHDIIEYLKAQPKPAKAPAAPGARHTDVPAGRYAILDGGVYNFYQVDRPDKGKWAGYTFVNQLFGAPGDFRRVGVKNADARYAVLAEIAKNVIGASAAFGKEHGVCGVCGSPLTNRESIELGIGPVCLGRLEAAPAAAPAPAPVVAPATPKAAPAPAKPGMHYVDDDLREKFANLSDEQLKNAYHNLEQSDAIGTARKLREMSDEQSRRRRIAKSDALPATFAELAARAKS